ncbi:MAG: phosphohydrolase [Thermodesulfobacteria bacterium]|nr:phosphohydrolase [Thermodesulfobacteriota bacterium]
MKCPGQDSRYWKPGAIFDVKCPGCGTMIEFFKDDTRRRCPNCGQEVPNPEMDFGCAAYCPYAEHCLGNLPEGVVADGKLKVLKAKMLKAIKEAATASGSSGSLEIRFIELCEEIGKKESAPLGPTLLAAFGLGPRGLDAAALEEKRQKDKDALFEYIKAIEAEPDAAQEAVAILQRVINGNAEAYSVAEKVLHDAWNLAQFEYSKRASLSEKELFTDAAKQMLQAKKAAS